MPRDTGPLQRDCLALLTYALLVLAMTWPLVSHLGTAVPHDLGDPLLSTWTLWWNARVMPFTDAWWNGPFFFPAQDTLSFSDHRVGLGIIATPLIWSGVSPLAASNAALLLSYFLSAASAYALALSLTGHRGAAFVGGLVFGFHPFRADHVAHLELVSSYWLPVVLLALHRWAVTRATGWLVLLSASLTLQGLTSGYYLFYSGVLIAGWLVWFARRGVSRAEYGRLALALAAPLAVLSPVLLRYRETHIALGLMRTIDEIEQYSADLVALVTAPEPLTFWNTPPAWYSPEGALFPGLTALVLVAFACLRRREPLPADRWRRLRTIVAAVALVAIVVAMVPVLWGPVALHVAGVRISVSGFYKPLSIAAVFTAAWLLTTRRMRRAWMTASPLAFYTIATLGLWAFAMGPTVRLFGEQVFYKAPYAWLMMLPGFSDGFRAPARFAMLAALTSSVAAALACARVLQGRSRRLQAAIVAVVSVGACMDGWTAPFPLVTPPPPLVLPPDLPADAVIAELPFGTFEDATAMYHAISHGHPIANGLSGYFAPHYVAVRVALAEGSLEALAPLATTRDVAMFVARSGDGAELGAKIRSTLPVTVFGRTAQHDILWLPHGSAAQAPSTEGLSDLPITSVTSASAPDHVRWLSDGDHRTVWMTPTPQNGGEQVDVDLGGVRSASGVVLMLGRYPWAFPRNLAIDVSTDGIVWTSAWQGETAGLTVAAAISDPGAIAVSFLFPSHEARYLRLQQRGRSKALWAIAEIRVLGR